MAPDAFPDETSWASSLPDSEDENVSFAHRTQCCHRALSAAHVRNERYKSRHTIAEARRDAATP